MERPNERFCRREKHSRRAKINQNGYAISRPRTLLDSRVTPLQQLHRVDTSQAAKKTLPGQTRIHIHPAHVAGVWTIMRRLIETHIRIHVYERDERMHQDCCETQITFYYYERCLKSPKKKKMSLQKRRVSNSTSRPVGHSAEHVPYRCTSVDAVHISERLAR